MDIIQDDLFILNLKNILRYISKDSKNKAKKFMFKQINNLINMPYKFRKSYYYDDENIRDMVFKGYTIPYLIDIQKNTLVILDIFKYQHKNQTP
jgi:mRNA-degrading endonuclease RelE of RelBE toxin-antitoxin system